MPKKVSTLQRTRRKHPSVPHPDVGLTVEDFNWQTSRQPLRFWNPDYEGLAADRPAIMREAKAERSRLRAAIFAVRHLRDSI